VPPVKIAWKLANNVTQVGFGVPSADERALLVQLPDSGAWARCTATGKTGPGVTAERSLNPPLIINAPTKLKLGDKVPEKVMLQGRGFGPTRGPDDAVYLVPGWGAAQALDHQCKGAAWSDSSITACLPASVPAGPFELRVQAGDELALAAAPVVVTR
jgi:hypothetical protein